MKRKYIFASILIVGMIAGMLSPAALPPPSYINVSNITVVIDLYHGGYHTTEFDLAPLIDNLTKAGNEVVLLNDTGEDKKWTWSIPDEASIMFLTQSDNNFTMEEMVEIKRWMMLENRLLVVAGDSDYGGYFDNYPINSVLAYLGAIVRLDDSSISDPVDSDGSSYRAAATIKGHALNALTDNTPGIGMVGDALTAGCDAGIILHGPCSILANTSAGLKDMRGIAFPRFIETLWWFGQNATADDSDVSDGDYDIYSADPDENGDGYYPGVVFEDLVHTLDIHSYVIASGEAFYTFYKYMYNMYTETGVYNGGEHYGMMFTNNIINYFGIPVISVDDTPFAFLFAIIPLVAIGAIYAVIRRKR
ncbi:MAG: hypothetical protein ACW96U_04410 [Candidatus Heimdallarchaeaceae archaeon]|jgi:hypothetical protein